MDTTKEYIEMCERAKEIQEIIFKQKKIIQGDTYCINETKEIFIPYDKDREIWFEKEDGKNGLWWVKDTRTNHAPIPYTILESEYYFYKYEDNGLNFIWLPRQDQLQDMTCKELNFVEKLQLFYNYVRNKKPNVNSMTQLWLSFVMRMEYKKEWVDNEWRPIK